MSAEIITMVSTGVALLAVILTALHRQDARLEKIESGINGRFDKVDDRLNKVDRRLDKVDDRFQRLEGQVSEIAVDVGTIKGWLAHSGTSEHIGAQLREFLSDDGIPRRGSAGDNS